MANILFPQADHLLLKLLHLCRLSHKRQPKYQWLQTSILIHLLARLDRLDHNYLFKIFVIMY